MIQKCKRCYSAVSADAVFCMHCGLRDPLASDVSSQLPLPPEVAVSPSSENSGYGGQWLMAAFIGVAAIFLLAFCRGGESKDSSSDTFNEYAFAEQAKDAIKGRLKDPESAQFMNVKVYRSAVPAVCGEVNAKNGFGGYTGYKRFVSNTLTTVLEDDMAPGEMDKLWQQTCY